MSPSATRQSSSTQLKILGFPSSDRSDFGFVSGQESKHRASNSQPLERAGEWRFFKKSTEKSRTGRCVLAWDFAGIRRNPQSGIGELLGFFTDRA
jgi:hypothetical protein